MSRADRLATRNVQIYDLKQPDTVLGGLYLAQDVTNSSFYAMLDTFIVPVQISSSQDTFSYYLKTKDGAIIARDSNFFKPGTYHLVATGKYLRNSQSRYASSCVHSFNMP